MSRRIHRHLAGTGMLKDTDNFERTSDKFSFTEAEYLSSNHDTRSKMLRQLRLNGFYRDADRLKAMADLIIKKNH
jgi:nanoRNase/pAp phosphatase (c-di-AMP/oligoRNAs hydrolase)